MRRYGVAGAKELWEVPKENHRPGLIEHTIGWPLKASTYGGSFLYHFDENLKRKGPSWGYQIISWKEI